MDQQAVAPVPSVVQHIAQLEAKEKEQHAELKGLRQKVRDIYLTLEKDRVTRESLKAYNKVHPEPEPPAPPSLHKRKKYQPIPKETRALVAKKVFYEGSLTWDEACQAYDISRISVARILNAEKRKGDDSIQQLTPPKKRGRKSPLTVDVLVFILDELEKNSQLSLRELINRVESHFPIETSTSAIDRALTAMDISWKNVLRIPESWNTDRVIEARMAFVAKLSPLFLRTVIYMDESGFNMHCKKSKGRALKGEPAKLTLVPKGKRLTVVAALGPTGFIHWRLVESCGDKKGTNAEDFRNFLIDLFPKIPRDSVIILDNCKIHHAENVDSTWIMGKTTYGIDHIFLPPYSPFLNPIEYAFNILKEAVASSQFQNRGELRSRVEEKLQTSVTPQDASGFYRQSAKYYKQCAIGLPFQGKPLNPDIDEEEVPPSTQLTLPSV